MTCLLRTVKEARQRGDSCSLDWCVLSQCCVGEGGGFQEENCFSFSFPGLKDDAIKAVPLVFIGRSSSLTCHRIGVAS